MRVIKSPLLIPFTAGFVRRYNPIKTTITPVQFSKPTLRLIIKYCANGTIKRLTPVINAELDAVV